MSGLLIAAPSSGSGKTTVTLGLMRALKKRGVQIAPGKAGPDYIDPAFHAAATGEPCFNFDPWAMRPDLLMANAVHAASGGRTLIIEAMMGLHDGAADGSGTPADLAATLDLAVVLVVDCARMSQSVAALVRGYADHRNDIRVAGVILNKVGSDRHEKMLRDALEKVRMPVFGVLRQDSALALPERHLGLVQAGEHGALEGFIEVAAQRVERACDLDAMRLIAAHFPQERASTNVGRLSPLGQRIAVARDIAFAFSYEHLLFGWRRHGVEISFFSPLADEAPDPAADAVYLPGGYPELHAGRLSAASAFRAGMQSAAERGARIFGECGGYMVLGEGLVAADGARYEMLGLLPLATSFAERRRHLGYRRVVPVDNGFFDGPMTAHEFHYATIVAEGAADRLFAVSDAAGEDLGAAGLRRGNVAGSFMHLIDIAAQP
ncbi:cobyrinate a,c-diamide synthase [Ensifer sp.]|jgi:cobyrinic acid a,c-diamide synthase|uniref:cobyrinate a,c-diamide synthase n=1 Tax=Ensifer sp. TaxID=1872086 RepID=UPI002E15D339|nr:cobyrinate a,c-diamide synthase [Ensifer sp.]